MGIGFFKPKNEKGEPLKKIGFRLEREAKNQQKEVEKTSQEISKLHDLILAEEHGLKELEQIYIKGFHELENMHNALEQIDDSLERLKQIEIELKKLYSELIKKYKKNEITGISIINNQISKLNNNAYQIMSKIMPILDHLILRPSHKMYRDDKKRDSLHVIDKKAKEVKKYFNSLDKELRDLNNEANNAKNKLNKIGFKI